MTPNIIFGPPGTGKTTTLLSILEGELKRGIPPDKIAFVSYTRKAVHEARARAVKKFKANPQDLKYWRTLHSLAYRMLGLDYDKKWDKKNTTEFSALVGLPLSDSLDVDEGLSFGEKNKGDLFLHLIQLARSKMVPLTRIWMEYAPDCQYIELQRFYEAYENYKRGLDIYDYTDLLEMAIEYVGPVQFETIIVDEAQDLSALQWKFINRFLPLAKNVYIAGDPDQALFEWNGASPDYLLRLQGNIKVLDQSYRVPKAVHAIAKTVIGRCTETYDKNYKPLNESGNVEYINDFSRTPFDNDDTWFLLGRNGYLLNELEEHIKLLGIPYSIKNRLGIDKDDSRAIDAWEKLRQGGSVSSELVKKIYDYLEIKKSVKRGFKSLSTIQDKNYTMQELVENHGLLTKEPWHKCFQLSDTDKTYYTSVIKNYYSLTDEPKIHINTIHGVKGGEADNIFLLTDMAKKTYDSMLTNPNAEHRVFYTGITRAKRNLYIMTPRGKYGYYI